MYVVMERPTRKLLRLNLNVSLFSLSPGNVMSKIKIFSLSKGSDGHQLGY